MTTPAILISKGSLWTKKPPIQVADAPKITKTKEKPSTNMAELIMAEAIFLSVHPPSVMSSIERPDTKAIYPGISGSTQGDRNDKSHKAF